MLKMSLRRALLELLPRDELAAAAERAYQSLTGDLSDLDRDNLAKASTKGNRAH